MAVADVTSKSIDELVSLRGKVAAVTGGARGIGRAIALRFAEAGADVAVGDLTKDAADAVAEELLPFGVRAFGAELDVQDELSVTRFAERVALELGTVDVWVNNAGIFPATPVLEMDAAQWDRVLDVNLKGTFLGSRIAAARMVADGHGGVIVNVASTAGFRAGGPGVAHYVSSKHGMVGLTKSLAVELGPHGIRALGVAPTLIDTPGIDEARSGFLAAGLGDVIEQFGNRLPLGRAGVPDDVARVALFCASDLSLFMTGSTLLVDAGDVAL
jgi:NAD(P)-dependent dehydrogenase (short-subunit alcohol dehydrogenase family)